MLIKCRKDDRKMIRCAVRNEQLCKLEKLINGRAIYSNESDLLVQCEICIVQINYAGACPPEKGDTEKNIHF